MTNRMLAVVLLLLALAPVETARGQDEGADAAPARRSVSRLARLVGYEAGVPIARPGRDAYVVHVEIPAQTLRGDRFRVLLHRPEGGKPAVRAFGRLRSDRYDFTPDLAGAGDDDPVDGTRRAERLPLSLRNIRYDSERRAFVGRYVVTSVRHRAGAASDGAREADPTIEFEIPLPDLLLRAVRDTDASGG